MPFLESIAGEEQIQDNTSGSMPEQAASGNAGGMVSLADAFRDQAQPQTETNFTDKSQGEPMVSLAEVANAPPQNQRQQDAGYLQNRLQHYRGLGGADFGERLSAGVSSMMGTNTIDAREQERQRAGQFGTTPVDYLPFAGHAASFERESRFNSAVSRIDANRGTNADFEYVAQFISTQERNANAGFWDQVATGTMRVPAFMAEVLLTGGAGRAGYAAGAAGAEALIGGAAESLVGRAAVATAGYGTGLAAWTAANPLNTLDTAAQRARPNVGTNAQGELDVRRDGTLISQLPAGFLDTAIELGSEQAGEALSIAGKVIANTRVGGMLRGVGQRWSSSILGRALSGGETGAMVRSAAREVGYHGIAGEMFEERVGEILRGVTGLRRDQQGNRDYGVTGDLIAGRFDQAGQQLAQEFVQFGAVSVAFGVAGRAIARNQNIPVDQANQQLDRIQAALQFEREANPSMTRADAMRIVEQATEDPNGRMAGNALAQLFPETAPAPVAAAESTVSYETAQETPTAAVQTTEAQAVPEAAEASPTVQTGQNQPISQEKAQQAPTSLLGALSSVLPTAQMTPRGEVQAEVGGRQIYIGQDLASNTLRIDFEADKPGVPAELQKGSMDLMRALRGVVSAAKDMGSRVEFRAVDSNRGDYKRGRADIYGRMLERAGFEQVGGPGIDKNDRYVYAPKAEKSAEWKAKFESTRKEMIAKGVSVEAAEKNARGLADLLHPQEAPATKPRIQQNPIVVTDAVAIMQSTGLKKKDALAKIDKFLNKADKAFNDATELMAEVFRDEGSAKVIHAQPIPEAINNPDPGETSPAPTIQERILARARAKTAASQAKQVSPPTMKEFAPEPHQMKLAPGEEFMTPEMKTESVQMFERMANGERVSPADIERASGLNDKESHVLFQRLEGRTLEDIGRDAHIWGKTISKQGVAKWEDKAIERSGMSKQMRERIQQAEKARNAANLVSQGKKVEFADRESLGRAAQIGLDEREAGIPQLAQITQLILNHKGPISNEQRRLFEESIARAGTEPQTPTSARGQTPADVPAQNRGQTAPSSQAPREGANAVGQAAATAQTPADPLTLAMKVSDAALVELRFAKDQLEHWQDRINETGGRKMVDFLIKKVRKRQVAANAAEKMVRGIEDASKEAMPEQGTQDYMVEMNLRQPNLSDFMREELELQKSKYGATTIMQELIRDNGVKLDIDQARRLLGKNVLESYPPQLFKKDGAAIDVVAQTLMETGRIPENPKSTGADEWLMQLVGEHYLTERGKYDEIRGRQLELESAANDAGEAEVEAEQERAAIQTEGGAANMEEEVAPGVFFYDPRQFAAVQAGQLPPGPATGSVVGPYEFIKSALNMFGLQRYVGKVRQNASAAYLQFIRALEQSGMAAGDVPVAMHEIGHDIAVQHKFQANPILLDRVAGADVVQGFQEFDYVPNRKELMVAVHEGFAEWVRIRTTSEFANLSPEQQAANDYAEKWIADKGIKDKLDRLRDLYRDYADANPVTKMSALVSPDGKPVRAAGLSAIEAFKMSMVSASDRLQDMFDDRLAVFTRLAAERMKLGMTPFAEGMDPRTVIAQTQFLAAPWADEMAGKGMFTFIKDPDLGWVKTTFGKPIQTVTENLKPGETEAFKDFLIANHVTNQVNRGIELLKSGEDAERAAGEQMVNTASPSQLATMNQFLDSVKLDADQYNRFLDGAQLYTEMWSNTLDAMVQVGFKTQDQADFLREKYPDYVPLVRVMETADFKPSIDKARHGSGRQFIDPFLTLEARYRMLANIMARQMAHDSLWESGRQAAGPWGVGAFWKEVEGGPARRFTDLSKIIETMGVDDQMRQDLLTMIGADSLDVLFPPAWQDNARNTFTMMIDGQAKTIEVADRALYEALTHTQGHDSNLVGFARAMAAIPGMPQAVQGMKWGATTASMVFQPRNAIRDPWAYFQNVRGDRGFLTNFADLLAGQRDSFWAALEKVLNIENSDVYSKLYRESAGMGLRDFSFSPEGAGAEAWRKARGQEQSKVFKVAHKIGDVLELMGAAEHGPRMAEFKHSLEEMGYTKAKIEAAIAADPNTSPIPLNVMIAARQRAAEATVDFARQGVFTKEWNKVAPFFGAHMVAMNQELRNWNAARAELQAGKVGPKATAMLGGLGVYLAAELLHYWMRKDEPWYNELPAHLRHGWFILGQTADGGVWGVPKPQGIVRMIGAYFQETLRAAGDRNARFGMAGSTALQTGTPRLSPLGIGEAFDVATNRSWSGRPIVPGTAERSMTQFDQWTRYRLPYILEQMSGGLASERAIRPPWEAFKASRTEPRQTVEDYYNRLHDVELARNAIRHLNQPFSGEAEYQRLHSVADQMRALNRELRGYRQVGNRTVVGTAPTQERAARIRLQQLQLARLALGKMTSTPI